MLIASAQRSINIKFPGLRQIISDADPLTNGRHFFVKVFCNKKGRQLSQRPTLYIYL
jgi:hypothetical protein